jgi:hypothetical protein
MEMICTGGRELVKQISLIIPHERRLSLGMGGDYKEGHINNKLALRLW